MTSYEVNDVKRIREEYEEKGVSTLDELRALDRRVKRPAEILAYTLGTVGALTLGTGMCLAMEVIGTGLMPLGIAIGLVGIAMVSANYFLYKSILGKRRARYRDEIIALSNEALKVE